MRFAIHGHARPPSTRIFLSAYRFLIFLLIASLFGSPQGMAGADSVVVPFLVYGFQGTQHYVPGEFNNWGPNSAGVIAPGAPSSMSFDTTLDAWYKQYVLRVQDDLDLRRTLGDSIFQYKFNAGGASNSWFADPLNPETNPADHSNSILRLSGLFWFQYRPHVSSGQITRITAGLVHGITDTVTRLEFGTSQNQGQPLIVTDILAAYDAEKRIIDFTPPSPLGEGHYVQLTAQLSTGDSVVLARGGYAMVVAPMPQGLRQGVTLTDSSLSDSVGFRFWAPVGSLVFLKIAPAGQSAALADPIVMKKHVSSADWWTYVQLPQGEFDYLFQIFNGPTLRDPWGREHTANASRFTNGPAGLSADDYAWGTTEYHRPAQKDLVIYELNIGEFAGGYFGRLGNFRDMVALLPYLDSLGVNAIELMPVTDYGLLGPSGFSWGYDVSSWFALEPSYGTARDLKELVDSAHARGIAVILDLVFNHLNDPSPLWQMAPDVSLNPYFKNTGGAPNENDLAFFRDVDHWNLVTQEHVYRSLRMWLDEFRVDGFRYDYTQGIGWDVSDTLRGILGWADRISREYGTSVYQIAEHLPESPALLFHSGINGGWHDSFRDRLFDEARFKNQNLASLEDQVLDLGAFPGDDSPSLPNRYAERSEPVNYTVSHDEQSLVYEMTVFQGVSTEEALRRDKLYAVFMFTSLGIPMLWQGQETGEPRGWQSDGEKLSYRPVDWSRRFTPEGWGHWKYFQTLIRQRTANAALRDGQLRKLWRYDSNGQKVLVWGLEDTTTSAGVMVIANLGSADQVISSVPWISSGVWYDIFTQQTLVTGGTMIDSIRVPAYTALVYSNRSNEELNIPTGFSGTHEENAPETFVLSHNYPNPFNPETHVNFSTKERGHVRIAVYDLLGREVATLVNGQQEAGRHIATWNAAGYPSGVYFCRMTSGAFKQTIRLVLSR